MISSENCFKIPGNFIELVDGMCQNIRIYFRLIGSCIFRDNCGDLSTTFFVCLFETEQKWKDVF